MILLHNMLNAGKHWFAICYTSYNNKFVGNLTRVFLCITNCFYFLYNWNIFLTACFFTYNGVAYTSKLSLVIKKEELLKTSLHLLSRLLLLLYLLFSLNLFKIHIAISKCLAMSKYATLFK